MNKPPDKDCIGCSLYGMGYVPGVGYHNADVMLVGEAPGKVESFETGVPFTGPAGAEMDRWLKMAGLRRELMYVTNLVKCNPPDNRDPTSEEVGKCERLLLREVQVVNPTTIATLGVEALHYYLPDADLEQVWGIPQRTDAGLTIFPLYHPAYGLHMPRMLPRIVGGFQRLAEYLEGRLEVTVNSIVPDYSIVSSVPEWFDTYATIAVDTELTWEGQPLSVQLSGIQGKAVMVLCSNVAAMQQVKRVLERTDVLVVLHNAMFDLAVLHSLNIHPVDVVDTMVMSYLLQDQPQGLKPLAYRMCGMSMQSYNDVLGAAGKEKAVRYLEYVLETQWPPADPLLTIAKDGTPRIKRPQSINSKVKSLLTAVTAGKCANPETRWEKMDGREIVELALGPIPRADLRDVDTDTATNYACKDADATRSLYPVLKRKLADCGLLPVLDMDMGIVPMVLEMQRNGITVSKQGLAELNIDFTNRMLELETDITRMCGNSINIGSPQQVAGLLEHQGIKLGRKGKSGYCSTDSETLEPLRGKYPLVDTLLKWRKYATLRKMFVNTLPTYIHSDGKVHTTINITRTATGRLSTKDPNLMAQPVKDEESKLIRNCFTASPGYVLLSFDFCLAGGTKIITNRGEIPIMHIEVGDGVLSVVGKGPDPSLTFNTVQKTICVGVQELYEVGLEDGSTVRCTGEHKWRLFHGGWIKTKDLKLGDRLSHVKQGLSGRYPTWWIYSHCNYQKKHLLVSRWRLGKPLNGFECDHKDGDYLNWHSANLQYLPKAENSAQGGKRYWREVKNGQRSDTARLHTLRKALKKRRTYHGRNNPNYGKRKGVDRKCPTCRRVFYSPPSHNATYCSRECYFKDRNHRVAWVVQVASERAYQITVEKDHNYVLANGLISQNSQIEMRIAAHCAEDQTMIKVFLDGADIHSETASKMFNLPIDKLDKVKHRYPAKRIGFGILYGIGPNGLLIQLESSGATGWTLGLCESMIKGWLLVYRDIANWMEENKAHARRLGYVVDMFGRRRLVNEVWSTNRRIAEGGLRQAMNAPVQSGAQGVIKLAMAKLWKEVVVGNRDVVKPLLQIHDDLLFEVKESEVQWVQPLIQGIMETEVALAIPTPVEPKVGEKWGTMM